MGILCWTLIWVLQIGQCDLGVNILKTETSGLGSVEKSLTNGFLRCSSHARSIIIGIRYVTTLRKLPAIRPSSPAKQRGNHEKVLKSSTTPTNLLIGAILSGRGQVFQIQ